jgi:predicted nucleic acid-binding protein
MPIGQVPTPHLEAERGGDRVKELLTAAKAKKCRLCMCAVNLGEVMYIVERERGLSEAQDTLTRIDELPLELINADRKVTLAAAHLKEGCTIAYADCFAAALAQLRNAILITGDPEFSKIKTEYNVHIEWIANEKE